MSSKNYELDMCNGPLLTKILIFAIPLMLSGILQLLFNATNMVVAGRYIGPMALAAIGSTSSLTNLLVNLFIGLSVGSSVTVSHYYGAGKEKDVSETVHTAILLSLIGSLFLALFSIVFAREFLTLMGTPSDVLPLATTYMRVYFAGIPAILLYNFGSSILRAIGDTRRPLFILLIAGTVNVALNLLFVLVFHLGVAGTALGTILSECVSSTLVILCLIRSQGCIHLNLRRLRIYPDKLKRILRIGLPAGIQGSIFSISNVLIQSSVNSFGSVAMAGNTATMNLEGFIYTSMNSLYQTSLSFTGQNMGAKKHKRILRILLLCLFLVIIVGSGMGFAGLFFGRHLLGIYTSDPTAINYGIARMEIIFITYSLCGIMDVTVGSLRGMGHSVVPMFVSLMGACGLRILWIFTVFAHARTLPSLYVSYPVSWAITASIHLICFVYAYRKLRRSDREKCTV